MLFTPSIVEDGPLVGVYVTMYPTGSGLVAGGSQLATKLESDSSVKLSGPIGGSARVAAYFSISSDWVAA